MSNCAKNSHVSYTGLVEKYIGTAYDTVKSVANELEHVIRIGGEIENGNWDDLIATLPSIEDFLDDLAYFNQIWLGNHESDPVTDNQGNPLIEGALYFSTSLNILNIYHEGNWVAASTQLRRTEVITVDESMYDGSNTVIPLIYPYEVNENALMVFVESTFQYSKDMDPDNGAYEETDSKTITFDERLELGTTLVINNTGSTETIGPRVSITEHAVTPEYDGQQLFTLPNDLEYSPNNNTLDIYVNGILLTAGIDYLETSSTTVEFTTGKNISDKIIFRLGKYISNYVENPENITYLLNMSQFHSQASELNDNKPVLVGGYFQRGDGGGGVFHYRNDYPKALANGGTIVDTEKDLMNQGTNTGYGCWIREYSEILPIYFGFTDASLETLANLQGRTGDKIYVTSFLPGDEKNSNFAGYFIWDSTQPASAHNGGTIISPVVTDEVGSPPWYNAPSSAEMGCWVRETNGVSSNVVWFGARSNNPQLTKRAFAAAADVAPALVPAGEYAMTGNVQGSFYSMGGVIVTQGNVSIKNLLD